MTDRRDFFISFTSADAEIAQAINTGLRDAGYTTWFHPTDKAKGAGIADWMEVALDASTQMIALCSTAYFDRAKGYSRAERQSMFWEDPTNNAPLLILVKVDDAKFPRLIAQNEYIDLTGLMAPEAVAKLIAELRGEEARKARAEAEAVAQSRRTPEIFNVEGGRNPLFTGRDDELMRLHENIKAGATTAITAVKGMGGVGKSTLAREYAHRFGTAGRFGGVWWIGAETETSILTAYERLAGKVPAIAQEQEQRATAEHARDWLGQQPDARPWLVIFDNAPDAKTVAPWIPRGSARVIVTSRFGHFERLATQMSLDVWDEDTTVRYLMRRKPDGVEGQARALAKRLGGLPLAAEQAGAFLGQRPTLSFADYEARLIAMLDREPDGLPGDYPHSVFATFSVAIAEVVERDEGAAARDLLTLCAFLSPDGVEMDLLTECAKQTEIFPEPLRGGLADPVRQAEMVRSLTAYSLMQVGEDQGAGPELILHRLIAEIARADLTPEDHEVWAGAAVGMIRGLMPSGPNGGKGDPSADTSVWPLCAVLVPHTQALQALKVESKATGEKLGFVLNQAALYLSARGDRESALDLLRSNIDLTEAVYGDPSENLAAALGNLANRLAEREADWDEADDAYTRALTMEETLLSPDDPSLAITLSNIGGLYWRQKNFTKAVELTERAAEIDKAASGEASAAYAGDLSNLGVIYSEWANETGDPALREKERVYKEREIVVTKAARGMRHPETTASFNNLAVMHARAGEMSRAAEDMATAVAIDLSLDQLTHPETQSHIRHLLHFWTKSNQSDKAERLAGGDPSDLIPIIERIEAEHRAWVAEDPGNRHFGPRSPVTGATE